MYLKNNYEKLINFKNHQTMVILRSTDDSKQKLVQKNLH